MENNSVRCPYCSSPVFCDLKTSIRFIKKNLCVSEQGVDIVMEADENAETLPVMYSDDNCICCGFYRVLSDAPDAVFYQYSNLRCAECGELKDYALYRDDESGRYKLLRRDELRERQMRKSQKDKRIV